MKINKKAFIDIIMLGLFLIFSSVVFIGTVSDKIAVENKISDIRIILQTASLSAVKYYVKEDSTTTEAENIAKGIVEQTPLGGKIVDDIDFVWRLNDQNLTSAELMVINPDNLIVKLPSYTQKLFWFSFLGWDSKSIENMSSKANIVDISEAEESVPIAINGCNQEFYAGQELSFMLGGDIGYSPDNFSHFFPIIETDDSYHNTTGHKEFVSWKNSMSGLFSNNFSSSLSLINKIKIASSNSNAADVSQIISKIDNNSSELEIAVIGCDSSSDNLDIIKTIKVKVNSPQCSNDSDKCCSTFNTNGFNFDMFGFKSSKYNNDEYISFCMPMFCTLNSFADIKWIDVLSSNTECGKDYFRMDFTILNNNKVILEY